MADVHARRAARPHGRCGVAAWSFGVAMAAAGWTGAVVAAVFLNLTGIDGESDDAGHKNEIEIQAYDLALISPANSSQVGRGKVSCQPVTVFKRLDKSSPMIIKNLVSGKHVPQAVLTFEHEGEVRRPFFIVRMTEVFFIEFRQSAENTAFSEKLVLMPRRYEFEYRVQSDTGGPDGVLKSGWDCVTTETF